MKTSTALLAMALLTSCANSPMAVPNNYFAAVEPVGVDVEIPRSTLKQLRVYIHPSMTRAFVAPSSRDATTESWNSGGFANWSANSARFAPAYEKALQIALRARGAKCATSNPVAYVDNLAFEFTLSC